MNEPLFPIPNTVEKANILLEYIKYGIIVIKMLIQADGAECVFYVKSPEHIHMVDENGKEIDTRKMVLEFKSKYQALVADITKIIVKRAPYKNEFDDWNYEDSDQAYEEYKMFLIGSGRFQEEDLI